MTEEYIRRKDALLSLELQYLEDNDPIAEAVLRTARTKIVSLPYIKAEPVRYGRWEYRKLDFPRDGVMYEMYCTSCGETPDPQKYYKRCPNCGAKMDKENP